MNLKRGYRVLLLVYCLLLSWMVFFKGIKVLDGEGLRLRLSDPTTGGRVNLIPGRMILYYLTDQEPLRNAWFNLGGNLVAFLPLGFLLPAATGRFRSFVPTAAAGLIISVLFEILQYLARSGTPDVDDVLLNTAGTMLGYLVFTRIRPEKKAQVPGGTTFR